MIIRQFALSLAALTVISADALRQDTAASAAADNQLVFNNVCRTCHTLKEGDNRLGPNLHIPSAASPDQFQTMAIQVP
jgi:cytochrome c